MKIELSRFKACPILKLNAEGKWELESVEITGGLTSDNSASEADYDYFFTNEAPYNVSAFIVAQILVAERLSPTRCWINLPPLALARAGVMDSVYAMLFSYKRENRGSDEFPYQPINKRYSSIGFEVVERGELTDSVKNELLFLAQAGYPLALDDVGAGNFKNTAEVLSLCRDLQPEKLKFDGSFVHGRTPHDAVEAIMDWCDRAEIYSSLTIEGVNFDVELKQADSSTLVLPNRKLKAWANAVSRLNDGYLHKERFGDGLGYGTVQMKPVSLRSLGVDL